MAFQQFGFAMAAAILLDATIVRIVLVPATMKLLGDRNWYMPKFLAWLPQVSVEGASQTIPSPTWAEAGIEAQGYTSPNARTASSETILAD